MPPAAEEKRRNMQAAILLIPSRGIQKTVAEKLIRLVRNLLTALASMICLVMYGSGVPTGMEKATTIQVVATIRKGYHRVRAACFAVAAGSTARGASVRLTGAGTRLAARAATLVFGLSFPQGSRADGVSSASGSPSPQENLSRPRGTSRLTVFLCVGRWSKRITAEPQRAQRKNLKKSFLCVSAVK